MEETIIASSPILAGHPTSRLLLAIGFIPCLLHEPGGRRVSLLAERIHSSRCHLTLTAFPGSGIAALPHHDAHRFSVLVSLPFREAEGWVLKDTR